MARANYGTAPHGYHQPNLTSRGRGPVRVRKSAPLDHTYWIQGRGDTRRQVDPRRVRTDSTGWRATCDVCPWVGEWHDGWPAGADAADDDGFAHRQESLGAPGWGWCEFCKDRVPPGSECDRERHAQAYEDHINGREDPWA